MFCVIEDAAVHRVEESDDLSEAPIILEHSDTTHDVPAWHPGELNNRFYHRKLKTGQNFRQD